jgi:hypothetical protein
VRRAFGFFLALVVCAACKPAPAQQQEQAIGFAAPGQVGPFVIPASWTQTTWAVDGSNLSGCASDNNRTCSSTSCTSGDGPCLTIASIASRWGTWTPYLAQVTTINVISNAATSDFGWLQPQFAADAYLNISCALPTPAWSTTLGTVTAKNRATPQRLTAVLTPGAVAADQLVINTTHASAALTMSNSSTTWTFTQPVTNCAPPSCSTAEVDTWATGDAVVGYVPYIVNLYQLQPVMAEDPEGSGLYGIYVNNCQIQTPANQLFTTLITNANVWLMNSLVQSNISPGGSGLPSTIALPKATNIDMLGTIRGASGGQFQGGMIGNASHYSQIAVPNLTLGVALRYSFVASGSNASVPEGGTSFSDVYISAGFSLYLEQAFAFASGFIWGPGALTVDGGSFLEYPTGSTGAVTNLLMGGFLLNAGSTACSHTNATPDVVSCGISLTAAHLDAVQGAAGFGGFAYLPGGGTITNAQQ